jgi:hypothetical protein
MESFIGEIEFFDGGLRKATVTSKNFTDLLMLNKNEFLETIVKYKQATSLLIMIEEAVIKE